MSGDKLCFWCGSALDAHAEVEFKNEKTIVAKCPRDGEYAILPTLSAVLHHVRPDERAAIQQRLETWFSVSDDRLDLTRMFVEGITGRSLDTP